MFSFFSKTDRTPRERFFNPPQVISTDETSANSGEERASSNGSFSPLEISGRSRRLIRSNDSLEDLLEILLKKAEKFDGLARDFFLEQVLIFLNRNSDLVNRVPNNFHSNALELVLKIGSLHMVSDLLALKANVRPENRHLLRQVAHLLKPKEIEQIALKPNRYL